MNKVALLGAPEVGSK